MIYFIKNTTSGAVKVGYSADPSKRFQQLQCATPDTLAMIGVIPGGLEQEKALHRRLSRHHVRGEWFSPAQEVLLASRGLLDSPVLLDGRIVRNVYLAGKITGTDWRRAILPAWEVGGDAGMAFRNEGWPTLEGAIAIPDGRTLDYVGPYFLDVTGGHSQGEGPHLYADESWSDHCGTIRRITDSRLVAGRCRDAIERADLLFAWIDSLDCFGTILEIGYAAATPCHVVVASPITFEDREVWLSLAFADRIVHAPDPATAWTRLWSEGPSYRCPSVQDWIEHECDFDDIEPDFTCRYSCPGGHDPVTGLPRVCPNNGLPCDDQRSDCSLVLEDMEGRHGAD